SHRWHDAKRRRRSDARQQIECPRRFAYSALRTYFDEAVTQSMRPAQDRLTTSSISIPHGSTKSSDYGARPSSLASTSSIRIQLKISVTPLSVPLFRTTPSVWLCLTTSW